MRNFKCQSVVRSKSTLISATNLTKISIQYLPWNMVLFDVDATESVIVGDILLQ